MPKTTSWYYDPRDLITSLGILTRIFYKLLNVRLVQEIILLLVGVIIVDKISHLTDLVSRWTSFILVFTVSIRFSLEQKITTLINPKTPILWKFPGIIDVKIYFNWKLDDHENSFFVQKAHNL